MWERVIYTILRSGLDEMTAEPARLRRFFQYQRGLSAAEATALETKYLASPPELLHAYSQKEGDLPCIVISLESEEPGQQYLGDLGGVMQTAADAEDYGALRRDAPIKLYATQVQSRYTIGVFAEAHPDMGIFLYELVKYILVRGKLAFLAAGVHEVTWKGSSLSYAKQYDPHYAFERSIELTILGMYEAPMPALTEVFNTIQGLHVNLTADGETPADSDALVTPTVDGAD